MAGLDKIVLQIEEMARTEVEGLLKDAKTRVEAIIQRAEEESAAKEEAIFANARAEIETIKQSGESAFRLQKSKSILAKKQELIAQTMESALERLYHLPEEDYFNLILSMVLAEVQSGEGLLVMNARDTKRCPADFGEKLKKALPAGKEVLLSSSTREIDGGFVLVYGDIDINCSFRSIFNARREEFETMIQHELFI